MCLIAGLRVVRRHTDNITTGLRRALSLENFQPNSLLKDRPNPWLVLSLIVLGTAPFLENVVVNGTGVAEDKKSKSLQNYPDLMDVVPYS